MLRTALGVDRPDDSSSLVLASSSRSPAASSFGSRRQAAARWHHRRPGPLARRGLHHHAEHQEATATGRRDRRGRVSEGSPDIESSTKRVPEYTEKAKAAGVEIVDSIEALLSKVDVVFLETNDGRPHLEQLRPCLEAKKPVFIDKPVAGSLKDAIAIYAEAKAAGVPVFCSSSLRFGKSTQEVSKGSLGKVLRAETFSPVNIEPTHPDLYWYGVHGCESLYTVMGTGCISVKRGTTEDGKAMVTGTWPEGRTGIFRQENGKDRKGYGGKAVGEKGEAGIGKY